MKTLIALICLTCSTASAVDSETLVRVAWAQAVAERESLPEIPDTDPDDDDRGSGQTGLAEGISGHDLPPLPEAPLEPTQATPPVVESHGPAQESVDVDALSTALAEALLIASESRVPVASSPLEQDRWDLLHTPLEGTGEEPEATQVILFGFGGCDPCDEVKPWLTALTDAGWTARYMDVVAREEAQSAFDIDVCPTFIVFQDWEEVYRVEPTEGDPLGDEDWVAICRTLEELNVDEEVSAAVQGAFLNMGDLVDPLLGHTFELSDDARIRIPSGLRFRTEQTNSGLKILFTSGKPTAEVDKLVTWEVTIEGLAFSREELTLLLEGIPDVSVSFDWSN